MVIASPPQLIFCTGILSRLKGRKQNMHSLCTRTLAILYNWLPQCLDAIELKQNREFGNEILY